MPRSVGSANGIDVKEAVKIALDYVREVFDEDSLSNLGLEEVERDGDVWRVTVGFSRPWDYEQPSYLDKLSTTFGSYSKVEPRPIRDYKVVSINARNGKVEAVKNRE